MRTSRLFYVLCMEHHQKPSRYTYTTLHIQLHYHWHLQVLPAVDYFQKHIVMEFAAFHFFCSFHHWEDISKLKTVLICKNIDKEHHYQLLVLHIQKEHLVYCLCAYYVSIAKGSYLPISWNNWSLCTDCLKYIIKHN